MEFETENSEDIIIRSRIRDVSKEKGLPEEVSRVLVNLFEYMVEKQVLGCAHAMSAALYVALCELSEKPKLCVGEVSSESKGIFDHSWVELRGEVVDMGIYMTFLGKHSVTGVVVCGIDTDTCNETSTTYGCKSQNGLSEQTVATVRMPFLSYLDGYPFEPGGLLSVVEKILPEKVKFSSKKARKKYAKVQWIYVAEGERDTFYGEQKRRLFEKLEW